MPTVSPYDYLMAGDPSAPMVPQLGGPAQTYGPSTSIAGNLRERTPGGLPMLAAWPGTLGPLGTVAGSFTNAFGGLHDLKSGDFFHNLGNLDNWKNFATGGVLGSRRAADDAHMRQLAANASWQDAASSKLRDWLGGLGTDVRTGVQPQTQHFIHSLGRHPEQLQQSVNDFLLNRTRGAQARQVDAQFADPQHANLEHQWLLASQDQQQGELANQIHTATRGNAIEQARRGMQGSSVDLENQGQIGQQRDAGAAGIAANVDAQGHALKANDAEGRSNLMGLIYANDPNTARAFASALQGVNNQREAIGESSNLTQQRQSQSNATGQAYGQVAGNLLSSSAGPAAYAIGAGA